jgi:hypothetical protein
LVAGHFARMCAQPGSASQGNAERHGFRIASTRIQWHLAQPDEQQNPPLPPTAVSARTRLSLP